MAPDSADYCSCYCCRRTLHYGCGDKTWALVVVNAVGLMISVTACGLFTNKLVCVYKEINKIHAYYRQHGTNSYVTAHNKLDTSRKCDFYQHKLRGYYDNDGSYVVATDQPYGTKDFILNLIAVLFFMLMCLVLTVCCCYITINFPCEGYQKMKCVEEWERSLYGFHQVEQFDRTWLEATPDTTPDTIDTTIDVNNKPVDLQDRTVQDQPANLQHTMVDIHQIKDNIDVKTFEHHKATVDLHNTFDLQNTKIDLRNRTIDSHKKQTDFQAEIIHPRHTIVSHHPRRNDLHLTTFDLQDTKVDLDHSTSDKPKRPVNLWKRTDNPQYIMVSNQDTILDHQDTIIDHQDTVSDHQDKPADPGQHIPDTPSSTQLKQSEYDETKMQICSKTATSLKLCDSVAKGRRACDDIVTYTHKYNPLVTAKEVSEPVSNKYYLDSMETTSSPVTKRHDSVSMETITKSPFAKKQTNTPVSKARGSVSMETANGPVAKRPYPVTTGNTLPLVHVVYTCKPGMKNDKYLCKNDTDQDRAEIVM